MKKRLFSIIMIICLIIPMTLPFTTTAFAADYAQTLRDKGFPESYISDLVALRNKHPKWDFEPLITSIKWQTAINGERSSHSKNTIQKTSSLSNNYYCSCSSCLKNGSYVIQEGTSWVSASESALKYYMDPRNWLSEKYIFQFESTAYDSTHTKNGVESIVKKTWMYDSLINYVTTDGTTKKNYDSKTKYSDAIMTAAKDSGMSAYYLASRIVQEVGSASATTGGSCGTRAPFYGIYNYYNIGAYAGAMDGLAWAAGFLKASKSTTMYSGYSDGKVSGTKTSLSTGQYMVWRANAGDYYRVRLYTETGSNSYKEGSTGYVPKSACNATYFSSYDRPWTSPYKCITNGAKWIAAGYSKTQQTGYLQKYNVNPASSNLYNHQYMTNAAAPSAESAIAYNAYKNADLLSSSKTFVIPVFLNMPSSASKVTAPTSTNSSTATSTTKATTTTTTTTSSTKVTGLALSSRTKTNLTFKWNKVKGATKYYVYVKNNTKGTTFNKTVTTNSAALNGLTANQEYSVRVKAYVAGKYGSYTSYSTHKTLSDAPSKPSVTSIKSNKKKQITLKWKKVTCTGYQIQYSKNKTFKSDIKTINIGKSATSKTFSTAKSKTTYYVRIRAYKTVNGKKVYGSWSPIKSIKTK